MKHRAPPTNAGRSIALSETPDFVIGSIHIRPSLRETALNGVRKTIEPRVMRVLVALVQADGCVISRDELRLRCWDGTTVGEDAVNRSIAKVREILATDSATDFRLETVPRVGYRLIANVTSPASAIAAILKWYARPDVVTVLLAAAALSAFALEHWLRHMH